MIKLDEKDIEQVAIGRFVKKSNKWFVSSSLVLLIALFILGALSLRIPYWIPIIPAFCLFVDIVVWTGLKEKAKKALVAEWKKEAFSSDINSIISMRHQD